jgi:hypothetical protein
VPTPCFMVTKKRPPTEAACSYGFDSGLFQTI